MTAPIETIEQILVELYKGEPSYPPEVALDRINKLMDEAIGPDKANVATDDLLNDHNVSFAIQRRVKAAQRQRLAKLFKGG